MNEDEIRALVNKIIDERTMPKIWGMPDPEWLIPFRVYSRDYEDGLDQWVNKVRELEEEVVRLKAKIGEHTP